MPLPETSPGVLTPFLECANVGKEKIHLKIEYLARYVQYFKILV